MRLFLFLSLLMLGSHAALGEVKLADEKLTEQCSKAVERSLPLLQQSAAIYIEERDCFSCHHQALPAMTFHLAQQHGFEIDPKGTAAQSQFTIDYFDDRKQDLIQGRGAPGGGYSVGYALLGLEGYGGAREGLKGSKLKSEKVLNEADHAKHEQTIQAMVEYFLKSQRKDGHWRIHTHRPPMEDSDFTATALAIQGLKLYTRGKKQTENGPKKQVEMKEAIADARTWLLDASAKSTEDHVFKVHGLHWSNTDKTKRKQEEQEQEQAVNALLKLQQKDGGWAQLSGMESDAYATGQAIVALHQSGELPIHNEHLQTGIRYLLKTQLDDGSWKVKTRSRPFQTYFESGFPHQKSQFISMAGTCWATMALIFASEKQLQK